MVTCAVKRCKNNSSKVTKDKHGITYHRFPLDKERRKRWEIAVNRPRKWKSSSTSSICSEHFDVSHFYLTESGLRRLAWDAVPTINICPFEEHQPTVLKIQPAGIKPDDSEEVMQLKHKVRRLEAISANRKKKLNMMAQSERNLRKKLERLKCIIKHLILAKKTVNELDSKKRRKELDVEEERKESDIEEERKELVIKEEGKDIDIEEKRKELDVEKEWEQSDIEEDGKELDIKEES